MFSNPVQSQRADEKPSRTLWWVVAGVSFFCLIAALVNVVNGQVEKARYRDAQYNAARLAIAECANKHRGSARTQCVEQVNASLGAYPAYAIEPQTQAQARGGDQGRTGHSSLPSGGFMSASFATP